MGKYNNNPGDLTLLGEYTKLMNDMTSWTNKTTALKGDLSGAELIEYSQELMRILEKLSSAM